MFSNWKTAEAVNANCLDKFIDRSEINRNTDRHSIAREQSRRLISRFSKKPGGRIVLSRCRGPIYDDVQEIDTLGTD